MKKNIVWLASYPKSGNTWFRIFLANLRSGQEDPVDINTLTFNLISSSVKLFKEAVSLDPNYLTREEIFSLRSEVFNYHSSETDDLLFIKTHDVYKKCLNNYTVFPKDVSLGIIYFIRNPWDVAVSWAFHNNKDTAKAHKSLKSKIMISKQVGYYEQFEQEVSDWSNHIKSWTKQKDIPLLVMRYEDMKMQPLTTFRKALDFLNLDYSDEEILVALKKSSFDAVKKQEDNHGFKEKLEKQTSFFRKGVIGDWKNHLSKEQEKLIYKDHIEMIKKFHYDTLI